MARKRPDTTGTAADASASMEQRIYDYVNPVAFSLAPQGTCGNTPRTTGIRSPRENNWDLSIFKNFEIKEGVRAQFRAKR